MKTNKTYNPKSKLNRIRRGSEVKSVHGDIVNGIEVAIVDYDDCMAMLWNAECGKDCGWENISDLEIK